MSASKHALAVFVVFITAGRGAVQASLGQVMTNAPELGRRGVGLHVLETPRQTDLESGCAVGGKSLD